MRRLSAATVLFLGFSHAASAAITSHDVLFTSICTDEVISGLDWHNGSWAPATLYPNRYTLQKRDPASADCADALKSAHSPDGFFDDVASGCYTIADFGNAAGPAIACTEIWNKSADAGEALSTVTCTTGASFEWIIFDPTGNFEYAQLGGNLLDHPRDDIKDPLVVSVGKCRLGRAPGIYPPG